MNMLSVFFPGVWVHEGAHALACVLGNVKVHRVHVRSNSGVVVHDPTNARNAWMIAFAPLAAGTILSFLFFQAGNHAQESNALVAAVLFWLAISIGFHAIPSTTDATNIPTAISRRFSETTSGNLPMGSKLLKLAGYVVTWPIAVLTSVLIWLANQTILFRLAGVGIIAILAA